MDHSQVKQYFEDYIKKYSPYKDSKLYEALLDYLKENFTKNLYSDIPKDLKQLYEENYIDTNLYDYLLKGIGVPNHVLNQLPMIDKVLFFNNMTDFYRYRGNIDFFKNVTKLFHRAVFDVYELYVDYDEDDGGWVFKPYLIVKNTDTDFEIPNIAYNVVYNNVPSLLINETQLNHYKDTNNIVLPYKSNIVLLDCSYAYEAGGLFSLIVSTFIKEYRHTVLDVYFADNVFSMSLIEFYVFWYYILLKNYDKATIGGFDLQMMVEYLEDLNPYNLNDIENLMNEYNSLNNAKEAREFYELHIENVFKILTQSHEYNWDDINPFIREDLIEYVDNRVEEYPLEPSLVYSEILDEMLDSLLLYIGYSDDTMFVQYSEYFLNALTHITVDPKKSNPYILLYNFKPFHTELFTRFQEFIFSQSKFDMTTPANEYRFLMDLQYADVLDLVDYKRFSLLLQNKSMNQSIDTGICNFHKITETEYSKKVSFHFLNTLWYIDLVDLRDYYFHKIQMDDTSNLLLIDTYKDYVKNFLESNHDINNKFNFDTKLSETNLYDIVDYLNYKFEFDKNTILSMIDTYNNYLKLNPQTNHDIADNFNLNGNFTQSIIYNFNELNYIETKIKTLNSLNLKTMGISKYNHKNDNSSFNIVNGNFAFSYTNERVRLLEGNLSDFTTIGFGGLSVGDKIYNHNDDEEFAREIVSIDLENNNLYLDNIYQGPTKVGRIKNLSTCKEIFTFENENFVIEYFEMVETFEIFKSE